MDSLTAHQHLDLLRTEVRALWPGVLTIQRDSAVRLGEDRYEFAPRNSLHVQAPVTVQGKPRLEGLVWKYRRYSAARWIVCRDRHELVVAICQAAAAAGHGLARGLDEDALELTSSPRSPTAL